MSKKSKQQEQALLGGVIHEERLELASSHLRAITHGLRLQILEYIDKNPGTSVNNIYSSLELEQSITSQHLRILRNSELVSAKRVGKQIFYSVNYIGISKIVNAVNNYLSN